MGWTILGSNPGKGKKFSSSRKRLDPPSLVLNVYVGIKRPERDVGRLVLRLRMGGCTPLQPPDGVHRDIIISRGSGASRPATQAIYCPPNAHSVP
jgi:hypothetical protein